MSSIFTVISLTSALLAAQVVTPTPQPAREPLPSQAPLNPVAPIAPTPDDYLVVPFDVLVVNVFGQPEVSGRYPVRQDGNISVGSIGDVKVSTLTPRDIERELTKRWISEGIYRNPVVTVEVQRFQTQQVIVLVEGGSSAVVPIVGKMTVVEALARANAFNAVIGEELLVVRAAGTMQAVDLGAFFRGDISQDLPLQNGDRVLVKRAGAVSVIGQVRQPGSQTIRRGMTVLEVIAAAGGVTERGSGDRIRLTRLVNGKMVEHRAKPNDQVQAGDIIEVLERIL